MGYDEMACYYSPRYEVPLMGPLSVVVSKVCSHLCRPTVIKGTTVFEEECFGFRCLVLVHTACYTVCVSSDVSG
jgi:hypothetical protein